MVADFMHSFLFCMLRDFVDVDAVFVCPGFFRSPVSERRPPASLEQHEPYSPPVCTERTISFKR